MSRRRLEVADVVRVHRARFEAKRGHALASAEKRVLDDIGACRTSARGGHVQRCDACGHERIAYNSCRNRHCPKCEGLARAAWLAARESEILPVPYAHVVFTVPREIAAIAFTNRRRVYEMLFRAATETLSEIAADPDHLGASIGVLAVLHTWGQTMEYHPHVHCLVPAGGVTPNQSRWVACRPGFFLPVRVLARVFRGKFLHHLREAGDAGGLEFRGRIGDLHDPIAFRSYLAPLHRTEWVVHARPPFGTPSQVLEYLARYTHRVAIANSRLVALRGERVAFRWRDYRRGGKKKTMSLDGAEFLRRFLMHVLPKGFVRVRHYGFLANRCRRGKLDHYRQLLRAAPQESEPTTIAEVACRELLPCPSCRSGRMRFLLLVAPSFHPAVVADTS